MLILIVGLGSHQLISLLVKCPSQSMVPFTALSVSIIVFRIQINSQPALPPSVFNYNSSVKIDFFLLVAFISTDQLIKKKKENKDLIPLFLSTL